MIFSLQKVINGNVNIFEFEKILEILGDKINDEINIDGNAYRISSYTGIDGGTGGSGETTLWIEASLRVLTTGQTTIQLNQGVNQHESLQLFINGIYYEYGMEESYHIVNNILRWHGGFELEPTDEIVLKFRKSIY